MAKTTTTKITKFDPATCKLVAGRVERALAELGEELGVVFRMKGGNYTDGSYLGKLEVAVRSADGAAATRESEDFKKLAHLYDLQPEDLGREIDLRGEKVTIVGLRPRAQKFPVLVRKANGDLACMRSIDVAEKLKSAVRTSQPAAS